MLYCYAAGDRQPQLQGKYCSHLQAASYAELEQHAVFDTAAPLQGDLLVAGRRSATSGYLLKLILAEQVAGQPCK